MGPASSDTAGSRSWTDRAPFGRLRHGDRRPASPMGACPTAARAIPHRGAIPAASHDWACVGRSRSTQATCTASAEADLNRPDPRYAAVVATYLAVIGDRVALAWVLNNSMMAFPTTRRSEVDTLEQGDELWLLATRGCFRNPTRDRTRVIGAAVLRSAVKMANEPIMLIGRTFDRTCDIDIKGLAPVFTGVELAPLITQLRSFPNKRAWSIWLRRPLLRLTEADADLLRPLLNDVTTRPQDVVQGYLDIGRESLMS